MFFFDIFTMLKNLKKLIAMQIATVFCELVQVSNKYLEELKTCFAYLVKIFPTLLKFPTPIIPYEMFLS